MGRKRDVAINKIKDTKTKLLQRVKNIKAKTLLKLMCEGTLMLVVVAKMIILVMWEVNTFINK